MKNGLSGMLVAVLSLLTLSGCIESDTLVQVNKDGSGGIMVRTYLSEEAIAMTGGMDDMAAAMADEWGEAGADVPGLSELPVFLQGMVLGQAEQYGDSVRLAQVRKATNDQGWNGFMARFEFDDINQVRLSSGMTPGDDDADGETVYRFAFTRGDTAELQLIPSRQSPSFEMGAGTDMAEMAEMDMEDFEFEGEFDFEEMDFGEMDLSEMMGGMDDAMGAMFGSMFKGMRVSLYVEVAGNIVQTDARHQSEARPNRVTLMAMNMDELMSHPDALSQLMKSDPDAVYNLQAEGAPGVKMEDPGKTITIRFR